MDGIASFASKHPVRLSACERSSDDSVLAMEDLVRTLFSNLGFTISVLLTVAVTAAFAILFEASLELVVSMLAVGFSSAIAEYVCGLADNHHEMNPTHSGKS